MEKMLNYAWSPDDLLGKGSYGTVYKGYTIDKNKPVAVKKMNEQDFIDEDMEENLLLEIEVCKKVKGDYLVEMYDIVK